MSAGEGGRAEGRGGVLYGEGGWGVGVGPQLNKFEQGQVVVTWGFSPFVNTHD